MIKNISVVMIAKNAEATLTQTLDALQEFKEVIVYSNNSTDKTDLICANYPNIKLINGDFLGFGPTKNKATEFTQNDWIFSLDSDEVVTLEFIENLKVLALNENTLYTILRTNYYKDTQIKHCWGDDVIVRLYNKTKTSFTNKKVHEKIIVDGFKIAQIDGVVKHFPYSTVSDFIVKLDRYSTIFAQDNVGKKSSSPLKALLNAKYSFIKTYFFKRGFLDGYVGLVIAFSHMVTNFYKYIKLYELNKELKKKDKK